MFEGDLHQDDAATLTRLHGVLDELVGRDLTGRADGELVALWRELEVCRRRFAPLDHALIGEVQSRNLAHAFGARSITVLARDLLRVSVGEASARVKAADALGRRRGLTGEPLAPTYAQVAAAQAAGAIGETAARVITQTIDTLPDEIRCEQDVQVERFLVEQASLLDVDGLRATPPRRHVDAFKLLARANQLPDAAGISTKVLLTMREESFQTGKGTATTGHGLVLPARQAAKWIDGDTQLIPIVFNKIGPVTAIGTGQRLFTEKQQLAMIARDKGCCFPGCDAPPQWTQAHHVIDHAHGGQTSLDNGCLLCGVHHRELQKMGWRCLISDGIPHWIPPAWRDPDQTPIRNRTHDPLLI